MDVGHRTEAKFWYLELRFHCGCWNRLISVVFCDFDCIQPYSNVEVINLFNLIS